MMSDHLTVQASFQCPKCKILRLAVWHKLEKGNSLFDECIPVHCGCGAVHEVFMYGRILISSPVIKLVYAAGTVKRKSRSLSRRSSTIRRV